jgi:hypothetical protein
VDKTAKSGLNGCDAILDEDGPSEGNEILGDIGDVENRNPYKSWFANARSVIEVPRSGISLGDRSPSRKVPAETVVASYLIATLCASFGLQPK